MKIGLIGIILSVPLSMTAQADEAQHIAPTTEVMQPIQLTETTRRLSDREQKLLPICGYYIRSYLAHRPKSSVFLGMVLYNLERQIAEVLALPDDVSELFGSSFYDIDPNDTAAITRYVKKVVASYKAFQQCTIALAKIYYLLKYVESALREIWDPKALYEYFDESVQLILAKEVCSLDFESPYVQRITYIFDAAINLPLPTAKSFDVLGYMLRSTSNRHLYYRVELFIQKVFGIAAHDAYCGPRAINISATEPSVASTAATSSLANGSST